MLTDAANAIARFFQALGLPGIFSSVFLENIAVPLPTEIAYLVAQGFVAKGRHSYPVVLSVLTAGHLCGSLVAYRIGLWGDSVVSRRLKQNKRVVEVHEKLIRWYAAYGYATVFVTRFVGYVRPWSSFVAGFAEVDLWPFILLTGLGSLIYNVVVLYLTQVLIGAWRNYAGYHFVICAGLFLLFFGFMIYQLARLRWKDRGKELAPASEE